jgi:ubiquinone/menaquinone biosynthesis C-methylase UbiE
MSQEDGRRVRHLLNYGYVVGVVAAPYRQQMSFDVGADAYGRFMGRYSEPLAVQFLAMGPVRPGHRALDVGCGPGALTAVLSAQLGPAAVSAVDPSESFVTAVRARLPGVDVRRARAEDLPFADDTFDAALAQLVVHFMSDPVGGIAEMARVTRPSGTVSACVWDHGGGRGPLSTFWRAVRDVDPSAEDESTLPGAREGHLAELFQQAGLGDVEPAVLSVTSAFEDFEAWWEPYTLGVGPAGDYVAALDAMHRAALRARCAELVPSGSFVVEARAWAAVGRA